MTAIIKVADNNFRVFFQQFNCPKTKIVDEQQINTVAHPL
jgi:hypothetical protein